MTEKFQNGSLACYRVRKGFTPRTPDQIKAIAQQYGMPDSLVPAYAGDRAMASRAMQSQTGPAAAEGWLVKPLKKTAETLVYAISRVAKDEARERIDYDHETTVKWSGAGGNGDHIDGYHEVARAMDQAYQSLRGMVLAGDWTRQIIDFMTGTCQGVRFLDSGFVYWIPPQGTTQLHALRAMLDAVGIGLTIGEIEAEALPDVQEVAQGGLQEQLDALKSEIDAFDGTEPAKVYRNRLEKLRELRATQMAYEDALGVKFEEVRALGAAIDQKVREQLAVKLDTANRPSVAAQTAHLLHLSGQGEMALAQALIDGVIVLEGDADDVARLFAPEPVLTTDAATLEALAEVEGLDPLVALELAAPTTPSDIPATW